MNAGALLGAMPANVLESARAMVIAGFANEVEAVNQYAAPIQAATIHGASAARRWPKTTSRSPKVATHSASHWAGPVRTCAESCHNGNPNIRCASNAPPQQLMICVI